MKNIDQIITQVSQLFPSFNVGVFDNFTVKSMINNLSEDLAEDPTLFSIEELIETGDKTSLATLSEDSVITASIITFAAKRNRKSRGCHFREDSL